MWYGMETMALWQEGTVESNMTARLADLRHPKHHRTHGRRVLIWFHFAKPALSPQPDVDCTMGVGTSDIHRTRKLEYHVFPSNYAKRGYRTCPVLAKRPHGRILV
jgi:hypothetical protein